MNEWMHVCVYIYVCVCIYTSFRECSAHVCMYTYIFLRMWCLYVSMYIFSCLYNILTHDREEILLPHADIHASLHNSQNEVSRFSPKHTLLTNMSLLFLIFVHTLLTNMPLPFLYSYARASQLCLFCALTPGGSVATVRMEVSGNVCLSVCLSLYVCLSALFAHLLLLC